MKVWIVYKVLSHEMGEISSDVYGVYTTQASAEKAAEKCERENRSACDCRGYYQEFEVQE